MYHSNLKHAFIVFHLTLATVLLVLSVATAVDAAGIGVDTSPNWHLFVLATAEAIAAILFVIPLTTRPGGGLLIIILLIAFFIHAFTGDYPLNLLVYAAGVYFVVVHGNALGKTAQKLVQPQVE
jgi:hypothetical protein